MRSKEICVGFDESRGLKVYPVTVSRGDTYAAIQVETIGWDGYEDESITLTCEQAASLLWALPGLIRDAMATRVKDDDDE